MNAFFVAQRSIVVGVHVDSFPMIERCMRSGNGLGEYTTAFYTFHGCVTCSHETVREPDYSFNCDWCGTKRITPAWLQPRLIDGQLVVEKAEWSADIWTDG